MYLATDSDHAARATAKTAADPGEAVGKRLHQKGADHVNNDRDESFEPEHAPMMALSGFNVKAGKCRYLALRGEAATFSRLASFWSLGKVN